MYRYFLTDFVLVLSNVLSLLEHNIIWVAFRFGSDVYWMELNA